MRIAVAEALARGG